MAVRNNRIGDDMSNTVLKALEHRQDEAVEAGPHHIVVHPLTGHIGAEIDGPDLRQPLAPAVVEEIRAALLKWKVIFFRGQPLTHEQHIAFASAFGQPTLGHAVYGFVEGYPQVYSVARNRFATRHTGEPLIRPWTGWHSDVTAAVNPPAASILRGVDIPPYGGDTLWTNLVEAYQGLSDTLCAASSIPCAACTISRRPRARRRPRTSFGKTPPAHWSANIPWCASFRTMASARSLSARPS